MLTHTTPEDYAHTATQRRRSVHTVSMGSGKSCLPRIRRNSCSYVNRFNSLGTAEVCTEVKKLENGKFQVLVGKRGISGNPRIVYDSGKVGVQEVIRHIWQDLEKRNHRLYEAQSPGKLGMSGKLEFADGVSLLLKGLERMTGQSFDSRFAPTSIQSGCRTNFPTLEKVVFGQAMRHVRVRRPSGSKSFASGMPTTLAGGAKPPSMKEQISRDMQASKRNLEMAEKAMDDGNAAEAEYRFDVACEYELRASKSRAILNERASLLRERLAAARARKAAKLDEANSAENVA